MRILIAVTTTLLLAGCATSVMKSFIGQDIRHVVVKRGPPANANVYTLYAHWNEARQGWIVTSYEPPDWKCL